MHLGRAPFHLRQNYQNNMPPHSSLTNQWFLHPDLPMPPSTLLPSPSLSSPPPPLNHTFYLPFLTMPCILAYYCRMESMPHAMNHENGCSPYLLQNSFTLARPCWGSISIPGTISCSDCIPWIPPKPIWVSSRKEYAHTHLIMNSDERCAMHR